jgi:hypothetical protein
MAQARGEVAGEWFPVRDNPPRRGDLILMVYTEDLPGWARQVYDGQTTEWLWKLAVGDETGFPGPAMWISGTSAPTLGSRRNDRSA